MTAPPLPEGDAVGPACLFLAPGPGAAEEEFVSPLLEVPLPQPVSGRPAADNCVTANPRDEEQRFVDTVEFDMHGCALSRTILPLSVWSALLRAEAGVPV